MKILKLVQGTNEWLEARLQHFTASEAPAMMNESKFMSRNDLLKLKKTGNTKPVSDHLQKIFDKGHEAEAQARPIIEMEYLLELPSLVGTREVQGKPLLASFDGLNIDKGFLWEHKLWNETLAENVRNLILEPTYCWQLEHQMMVCGVDRVLFTVSDGTPSKMLSMLYESSPERRLELIAGWCQFDVDLDNYEVEAIKEAAVPTVIKALPIVTYDVKGTTVISNISNCLETLRERSQLEMNRELETDQDFADKDSFNKSVKKARDDLKLLAVNVQNQFQSHAEFVVSVKEVDSILQKMFSHGENQVKKAKEAKKNDIANKAAREVGDYMQRIEGDITPIAFSSLMNCGLDYDLAMKGKRTIESLQNAVDSIVADWKIEADKVANKVKENLLTLRELTSEHEFLFNDRNQLVTKDNEDLIAVIKTRISDHEAAEKTRLDKEREEMRIQEERKAQKKVETEKKAQEDKERLAAEEAEALENETKVDINETNQQKSEQKAPEVEQDLPFIDQDVPRGAKEHYDETGTLVDKNGKRSIFDDVDIGPDDEIPFAIEEGENQIEMRKVYSTQLKADIVEILYEYNISESFSQKLSEVLKKHGLI